MRLSRQIFLPFAVLALLLLATTAVVLYGMGYRLNFATGKPEISGTGLLVATSVPDGAQVFINDHLTTATDNTINLAPGEYDVKIVEEGYFPWQKRIIVQQEVVAKADALLLPVAPKLENITSIGVDTPIIDPSLSRIAYKVASQSAVKNGIYVFDLSNRTILTLQSASQQIANDTTDIFSQAAISWTPDGESIIATVSANPANPTTYLLAANSLNTTPEDITTTLPTLSKTWADEITEKEQARIKALRRPLQKMITEHFTILAWSPDETKILYTASQSGELPLIITPRLIGTNSIPEQRSIEQDAVYVYDIKEDRNYRIADTLPDVGAYNIPHIKWYPSSNHLIIVQDKKIDIIEYDGQNRTTIYAGPFIDGYVYPWPDDAKIVILTNLGNPSILPNLYTINIK